MRAILILAALFIASAANAGTITFSVTTAKGTVSQSYDDADANIDKIAAAYADHCEASNLQGKPPAPTPCTNSEIMVWWFDSMIDGTTNNVNNWLHQQAIEAMPPIEPINPTLAPTKGSSGTKGSKK